MSQGIKRRRSTRLSSSGYYNKRTKPIQGPTNFLSLEELQQMADHVKERVSLKPDVGVICGSGLGTLSELVTDATVSFNLHILFVRITESSLVVITDSRALIVCASTLYCYLVHTLTVHIWDVVNNLILCTIYNFCMLYNDQEFD